MRGDYFTVIAALVFFDHVRRHLVEIGDHLPNVDAGHRRRFDLGFFCVGEETRILLRIVERGAQRRDATRAPRRHEIKPESAVFPSHIDSGISPTASARSIRRNSG
jgi:hypothetical protein